MEEEKQMPVESGKIRQASAAMIMNFSAMIYGIMLGWASPMIPQLQSPNPPVGSETMSDETASWLNGIICVGGFVGTPLFGMITEKFGRKTAGLFISIPHVICWSLVLFTSNQMHLIIARFFAGLEGGGVIVVISLYVSEISSNSIRGMLVSLLPLFINTGIMTAYVMGMLLTFHVFAACALIMVIFYVIGMIFLPETPVYLLRCNRIKETIRSLTWLRNGNESVIEQDLAYLQMSLKESTALAKPVSFKDLFRDRATIKGLVISLGLLCGQHLSGILPVMSYTATIFEIAGSSLSPNAATIVIGVIQVCCCFLSSSLMERAGRRLLLLISCVGMCICHFILGLFCHLQIQGYEVASYGWIPVVALSGYVVTFAIGIGSAPFVVASEIFSRDISSMANSLSLIFPWMVGFIGLRFFPNLIVFLGIDGCFFLMASLCAYLFFFTYFLVPETKGRTLESILDELNGTSNVVENKQYTDVAKNISRQDSSSPEYA